MTSGTEVLRDEPIRREEALRMPGGFEPLHVVLALPRRTMRVFTSVIEIPTLTVFHSGQDLPFRCAIALELIRNDDARHIG